MIKKLRRRMTLLVVAVLILVTAGIVFFINFMNWRNITSQAESALRTLAMNSGNRPGFEPAQSRPGGENEPGTDPAPRDDSRPLKGQPPQIRDAMATLSNYYVVTLSSDGGVSHWTSDRDDLYSDSQVEEMTELVLQSGKDSGRIGTQFYMITSQKDQDLLIVLDERLEIMTARRVLRFSALIASCACLLLCTGAYFLIRFMVRPVQDAFERQRQFVWDASHELKTPLAVIGANAQVLEGEIGKNESLGYITDEVQRTNRMIQNLLTLAKTDQSDAKTQMKKVDLQDVILSAALPMESTAFDSGKTIETETAEEIGCWGNEDMLRQLMVILLSNAIKYSDEGSVIRIRAIRRGKGAQIDVSNVGDGIDPQDQQHIFDRFYRVDSSHSREVEGHGLGLAIARNIVDIHNGKISVVSEPCGNDRYRTTFSVWLKAAP